MMISPTAKSLRYSGRFMHNTPRDEAFNYCHDKLKQRAANYGYPPSVDPFPASWMTGEHELVDEYFYKYTLVVKPPTRSWAYWVAGKKYNSPGAFNPHNVEAFLGYHPEDGCPVLKELS